MEECEDKCGLWWHTDAEMEQGLCDNECEVAGCMGHLRNHDESHNAGKGR
jgi:hypothetical protein